MSTALEIINKYIAFFEKRGHKRIPNSPLIPENDPTTLFTSSGMQPLVPYLLGEPHPQGQRLVNVQNCFRAQDIEEVGDNRHTTFFRMLGNWSLGDPTRNASQHDAGGYFKKEQLSWFFEFLTKELKINPQKLYISVFKGYQNVPQDEESASIWKDLFTNAGIDPKDRIFYYDASKNWWSRSGQPQDMPPGEPGGPDSEVFFDFEILHNTRYGKKCHINCQCGRFLEIGNSVFMEYQKQKNGSFAKLPQKNVDFGGGLERILSVVENKTDIFQTSLFTPIIKTVEKTINKKYASNIKIIIDHFVAATFITASGILPSNKEQGYILRRLLRRGLDNFYQLNGSDITPIFESIIEQYKQANPILVNKYENIKFIVLEEEQTYKKTVEKAKAILVNIPAVKNEQGDNLKGIKIISAEDAFKIYSSFGLSPTQIKSLGYEFNKQEFAQKMEEHQKISRAAAAKKFTGGLAEISEKTIMGHTATHLLHRALKETLGEDVSQVGSNITNERIRFDFNYDQKLTNEQIKKIEEIVNQKIKENLPVTFKVLPINEAKKTGAAGLFTDKYQEKVKVYFIGEYSKEFCGGPHVDFTEKIKSFKIIKQENIGQKQRRLYAIIGE